MGIYKEKYTKEYFTGVSADGEKLPYGATRELDEEGNLKLRRTDKLILERIDFTDANVLEIGLGRGEAAKYVLDNGARRYLGIDFSEAAISLAKETLSATKGNYELVCTDAIDFVQSQYMATMDKIDVIILFDVVEHIPRSELKTVLSKLKPACNEKVILLINTPVYKYDNDVIKDGLNYLNNDSDRTDSSDLHPETAGMHCNKYTVESLELFMKEAGFYNLTRAHYFVLGEPKKNTLDFTAYKSRWLKAQKNGYKRLKDYRRDNVEYGYRTLDVDVQPYLFEKGDLSGLKIYLTKEYRAAVFPDGDYDRRMTDDFKQHFASKKIVFDIGGFMGVSSLLFAKNLSDGGIVYCFEPNPHNRERILDNLSLNERYMDRITLIPLALGDTNGSVEMTLSNNVDDGHSSTSRIAASHPTIATDDLPPGFATKTVDIMPLDEFVAKNGIVPDVIKVDIEGAEHLFLRGARETILRYKPAIYMEIHSIFCAMDCATFLYDANYCIEILCEEEDGRILIKCAAAEQCKKDLCERQRSIYLANETALNIQQEALRILKRADNRLRDNIIKENEALLLEKDNIIKENEALLSEKDNVIKDITNSRGYKLLESYRAIKRKLKGMIK